MDVSLVDDRHAGAIGSPHARHPRAALVRAPAGAHAQVDGVIQRRAEGAEAGSTATAAGGLATAPRVNLAVDSTVAMTATAHNTSIAAFMAISTNVFMKRTLGTNARRINPSWRNTMFHLRQQRRFPEHLSEALCFPAGQGKGPPRWPFAAPGSARDAATVASVTGSDVCPMMQPVVRLKLRSVETRSVNPNPTIDGNSPLIRREVLVDSPHNRVSHRFAAPLP